MTIKIIIINTRIVIMDLKNILGSGVTRWLVAVTKVLRINRTTFSHFKNQLTYPIPIQFML